MESLRRVVIALAVSALPMQFVFAEMEHRMGGLPGMPAHMLKPGGKLEHRGKYHPADSTSPESMFSFGQPGQPGLVSRTVRIDTHDNARFVADSLTFAMGETVQFEVHNAGKQPHELRIGDHRYQQEHAEMHKHVPGWEHNSPNSVVVESEKRGCASGNLATIPSWSLRATTKMEVTRLSWWLG